MFIYMYIYAQCTYIIIEVDWYSCPPPCNRNHSLYFNIKLFKSVPNLSFRALFSIYYIIISFQITIVCVKKRVTRYALKEFVSIILLISMHIIYSVMIESLYNMNILV